MLPAGLIVSLCFLIQVSSCDNGGNNTNTPTCTGCASSTPWSKAGTGHCYATKADCEAVEGSGCVLCD